MSKIRFVVLSLLISCAAGACDSLQTSIVPAQEEFSIRELPIINGTRVTGRDRYSTVALVMDYGYAYPIFCTGTLISQNYVLTAGHCISYCEGEDTNIASSRSSMRVAFGQNEGNWSNIYEIEAFYTHPKFICTEYDIENDIAILKLKKSVPLSVASPTLPLPPKYALAASEVDSKTGIMGTSVGFGKTNPRNENSSGTKYETTRQIYAVCSNTLKKSKNCNNYSYTSNDGFIYFYSTTTNTCQGDSGGPTFVERDGYEFVAGVTSYGMGECNGYDAVTNVSDYYEFIWEHVTDLASGEPEECFNDVDDNGDGRIDCDDPYCFVQKQCIPEDCSNKLDDNGNGLTDCEDPACADEKKCQPENCTNGIDDNDNGLIDCNERSCFVLPICQPEICDDGIDNNGDTLVDCNDPKCVKELKCQPEDCSNRVDDNGNGLIDCEEPECAGELICQPEICNDNIDNNGNGLVDCKEFSCMSQPYCQPENCTNGVDDNLNGLVDCLDPMCISNLACQPEICGDGIDNNGNGLVDCEEESCSEACSSSSGCSVSSMNHTTQASLWWLLLGVLPLVLLRKKEQR